MPPLTDTPARQDPALRPTRPGRILRSVHWAEAHPLLATGSVAAVARLLFALGSFVLNKTYLIGDEIQYIELAHTVAKGGTADSWAPFYGQTLYDSTHAFTAPIAFLFHTFTTTRLLGQLYAVFWGVVTAVLAARLAGEVVRRRAALLAGLVVALMPSQVLWSSVVLRESMVWAALAAAGVALALAGRATARGLLLLGLLAVGALIALGDLRSQTLVVAVWSLALAALVVGPSSRRWALLPAAVLMALVIPTLSGLGIGGSHLVEVAAPSLGATRTYMSFDANSAFTPTTVLPRNTSTSSPTSATSPTSPNSPTSAPTEGATCPKDQISSDGGALAIAGRSQCTIRQGGKTHTVVPSSDGNTYLTNEGLAANVRQLPRGLMGTALRPFPWEGTRGLPLLLARVENVAWYVLYLLAGVGLWASRRRLAPLAYPVLVIGGVLVVAALTQGNLGTAFRHRAQILWALAVLAAIGAEHLMDRREARRGVQEGATSSPVGGAG